MQFKIWLSTESEREIGVGAGRGAEVWKGPLQEC